MKDICYIGKCSSGARPTKCLTILYRNRAMKAEDLLNEEKLNQEIINEEVPTAEAIVEPEITEDAIKAFAIDFDKDQEELKKAMKYWELSQIVREEFSPKNYADALKAAQEQAETVLRQELKLSYILKAIQKRPGAHPGKGLPIKQTIVTQIFHLNRYSAEQIEALEETYVEKAIEDALANGSIPTRRDAVSLQKATEAEVKAAERTAKKQMKEAEIAEKMQNAKKASPDDLFAVALVDFTVPTVTNNVEELELPMAENSILFICVEPSKLLGALDCMKNLGFNYLTNSVWDKDIITPDNAWIKTQHSLILLGTKGDPVAPMTGFQMASLHFEHQIEDMKCLPDYYYSMIEQMCPGEQYLEVFSNHQFSDSWHLYELNSNQNKGNNNDE